jgi:predicted outer membrane protein
MPTDISAVADAAQMAALRTHTGLSKLEQDTLAGLSGDDYKRAYAQLMLQKQQETVSYISNVLKNNTTMTQINNLR